MLQLKKNKLHEHTPILRDYYGWYGYNESILKKYPELIQEKKICLEILRRDGNALRNIPKAKRTKKMCQAAVENYGWALIDVPEKYRTRKICTIAVKDNGIVWSMIPEQYRTEHLAICAVRSNPIAFKHMTEREKTPLVGRRAIEGYSQNLEYIPESIFLQLDWYNVYKQFPSIHIPKKWWQFWKKERWLKNNA